MQHETTISHLHTQIKELKTMCSQVKQENSAIKVLTKYCTFQPLNCVARHLGKTTYRYWETGGGEQDLDWGERCTVYKTAIGYWYLQGRESTSPGRDYTLTEDVARGTSPLATASWGKQNDSYCFICILVHIFMMPTDSKHCLKLLISKLSKHFAIKIWGMDLCTCCWVNMFWQVN